jgi:hypothetical protein
MLHATVATNMLNSPDANLAAHDHGELLGGILGNDLKPMVQTNKTSKNPMEKVWALPYGRWMSCVFHVLSTHGKALKEAGGYVALIMIPEDDSRMDLFTKFGAGCTWPQTCHPAYSMGFYVCLDDVSVVNINDLPACLKQTQVHSDMVKLKTDAEKKATSAAYWASDHGKVMRAAANAAYLASDHGKATSKATSAAYRASDHGKVMRAAANAAYLASDHGKATSKATSAAYRASDHGKVMRAAANAAYLASDHGKATCKATSAAYRASDHGKAIIAAWENSDHGKEKRTACRTAYNKTRRETRRAESALKRAATKLECVYCNARYYSPQRINEHEKQCTKNIE